MSWFSPLMLSYAVAFWGWVNSWCLRLFSLVVINRVIFYWLVCRTRDSYVWQLGNLKLQCRSNWVANFRSHEYVYLYWVHFLSSLPGLDHQRTVGLGYTRLDQRERCPGPLVQPSHLQDLGLSHQQPMGRSGGWAILRSSSKKGVRDLWSIHIIYRTWGCSISNRWGSPDLYLTPLAAFLRFCRAQRGSDRNLPLGVRWVRHKNVSHPNHSMSATILSMCCALTESLGVSELNDTNIKFSVFQSVYPEQLNLPTSQQLCLLCRTSGA